MVSLFFRAFALIFMAELGDKTQLATLSMAASSPKAWLVIFLGSASALVLSSLIAVLCGEYIGNAPLFGKTVKILSGVLFLVFGAITLFEAFK